MGFLSPSFAVSNRGLDTSGQPPADRGQTHRARWRTLCAHLLTRSLAQAEKERAHASASFKGLRKDLAKLSHTVRSGRVRPQPNTPTACDLSHPIRFDPLPLIHSSNHSLQKYKELKQLSTHRQL